MRYTATVAGTILLALCSACLISQDATARPRGHYEGAGISMGAVLFAAEAAYRCGFTPPTITMRGRASVAVDP
jgi:hypothetical protein